MNATAKEHARTKPAAAHATVLAHMRALKTRHLLLLALLPLFVVLWLPLLRGRPAVVPTALDPAPVATPAAPAAETAPAPGSTNAVASAAALGARLQQLMQPFEPRWSPDQDPGPFQATITTPDPESVVAQDSRLVPSAIVLSRTEAPVAIVHGQSYRPGDSVHGHLIVAIEERRVVYRDGIRTYAVPIPQPTLGGDHD